MASSRGLFVVLEGIDGSGTTTQARRLVRRLRRRGHSATFTFEPSSGPIGKHIRKCLHHEIVATPQNIALMFASDRLDHYEHTIAPLLDQGHIVVCDRYVMSSLAYQSVEGSNKWVASINRYAPRPDLTILLDVSVDVAAGRRRARGGNKELFDLRRFQRQVATNYRLLAKSKRDGLRVTVNGKQTPRQVAAAIDKQMERLWA
jgi:dTMP kinase